MEFSKSKINNNKKFKPVTLEETSPGCFFYKKPDKVSYIDKDIINQLLFSLNSKNLKLGRICLHKRHNDLIQAMVIALHKDYLVNYHFHNGPEILKIIDGELFIKELKDNGATNDHYLSKDDLLLLRLEEGIKHSVKSLSEWSIFLEIGKGPFDQNKTNYI